MIVSKMMCIKYLRLHVFLERNTSVVLWSRAEGERQDMTKEKSRRGTKQLLMTCRSRLFPKSDDGLMD